MRRRSATSMRPMAEAMTTAASAGVGRCCSRFGRRHQQHRDAERADDAGQLRPRAGGLGHRRARRAAADRKALEEAGGEVGDAEADHLLVGIDRSAAVAPRRRATARWCRRTTPAPPRVRRSAPDARSATPIHGMRERRQALAAAGRAPRHRPCRQIEHADDQGRADHRDQHGRAAACCPCSSRIAASVPTPTTSAVQLVLSGPSIAVADRPKLPQRSLRLDGEAEAASAAG